MVAIKKLFADLHNDGVDGVAFKNLHLKKQILSYFANTGDATITELSKELNFSSPKIAELLAELMEDGLIKDYGKAESGVGRRPNIYGLKPNSVFFIGVDVKKYHINIGLLDFKKTLIKTSEKIPFQLKNTQESLDELCTIIQEFTRELSSITDQIVGIGVNLSGRINYKTGYSYSFFHFSEEPLSKVIEKKLGIQTYLENDSRAMAYGEFCNGAVADEKNVLYINIDYGIGMGIMINGQLYYGKSGFAGEFGHIHAFNNEIICHCGKKGCLETEASGQALVSLFVRKLKEGASSIVSKKRKNPDDILLDDIIEAANHDDVLAIECIAVIGEKLGEGIAAIINLFNPELVILGGSLSATGAYIRLPVKSAVYKYSLSLVNTDTEFKMSVLGERAGIIGACLLVRNRLLALEP
jgi:predicted NBD/HSP70 family sugar kinase